jgi:hypothetical protein
MPQLNLSTQQRQWLAENTRTQDGKLYQKAPDGSWQEMQPGQSVPIPNFRSGSNVTFNFGGGNTPNVGVRLPLFGAGGDVGGRGIPGSGLPPVTFRPPVQTPPAAGASGPGGSSGLPVTAPGTLPPLGPGVPLTPAPEPPGSGQVTQTPTAAATTPSTPSRLPKIGGAAAAGTGAGITGAILDSLKKYGPAIAAGSKIVTDLSTGRAQGRRDESAAAFNANQQNTARYLADLNATNADLLQRKYLDDQYQTKTQNALRGGYFQGVEDINIPRPEGVPTRHITGGLRPSAFSNRKEVGAAMEKEAMTELLDPMRVASDPRPTERRLPALPKVPEMLEAPGPNAFDSILQGLSYGLSGTALINEILKANKPEPDPPTWRDLPITPPNPLVVQGTPVNLGDAPLDPYSPLDTLRRNRTGAGNWWGTTGEPLAPNPYLPRL